MSVQTCGNPTSVNPVVWREGRRKAQSSMTLMYLCNCVGALVLMCVLHDRLLATSSSLLPTWEWWTLAALMAGSAWHSLIRIRLERTRGTLEVLRSSPLVPRELLSGQLRMALSWSARALPLWALWGLWAVSQGAETLVARLLVLLPLVFLVTVAGSLLGVRLALVPQGSNWATMGGLLGFIALILMPAGFDGMTAAFQMDQGCCGMLEPTVGGYGQWNVLAESAILVWLLGSVAWLWNADLRALSGFELNQTTDGKVSNGHVPALWKAFDAVLLVLARSIGLERNPFFMRERARSLRKLGRQPAMILTALVPAILPLVVEQVLDLSPGVALAWCAIPTIFLWWMAGAETTHDAMTRELDGRTLDAVRVTPLDPQAALVGLVSGRLYPFVIGWLTSLPIWALYAFQPGVRPAALIMFVLVLLGVGFTAAVGGLRASCTSLSLKGEDRYYSQAVGNPALWAWPLASPLLVLFGVMPFHDILVHAHLIGAYSYWMPFDVITLFPTWFGNPELLPMVTCLAAVAVHALVMRLALRTDLAVAWTSVQKAMDEDIRKAGTASA